ncbi:MAG: hypothetical protein K2X93_07425 [Candidatus Obscuribacterales bacterium]|nr:hypothetical protein [Candidatus Obscuribacterales bacterium]
MKNQSLKSCLTVRLIVLSSLALLVLNSIPSRAQEYGNITPPPPRPRRAYSTVDTYLRTHESASVQEAPSKRRRTYSTGNSYSGGTSLRTKRRRASVRAEQSSYSDRYEENRRQNAVTKTHSSRTTGNTSTWYNFRAGMVAPKPGETSDGRKGERRTYSTPSTYRNVEEQHDKPPAPESSKREMKKSAKLTTNDTQRDSTEESKTEVRHEASYDLSADVTSSLTSTASIGKFKSYPKTKIAPPDANVFDIPKGRLTEIPPPQMPPPPTSLGGFELSSRK